MPTPQQRALASMIRMAFRFPETRPALLPMVAAVLKTAKWDAPADLLTRRFPKPKRGQRIEDRTPILPWIVGDAVLERLEPMPSNIQIRRVAEAFGEYANYLYSTDPAFAREVDADGNAGRDFLIKMMRRWAADLGL